MKPLLIIYAVVEAAQKTLLENILRLPRTFSRLLRGIFRIEALVNDCIQLHDVYYGSHFRVTWLVGNEASCDKTVQARATVTIGH